MYKLGDTVMYETLYIKKEILVKEINDYKIIKTESCYCHPYTGELGEKINTCYFIRHFEDDEWWIINCFEDVVEAEEWCVNN